MREVGRRGLEIVAFADDVVFAPTVNSACRKGIHYHLDLCGCIPANRGGAVFTTCSRRHELEKPILAPAA